MAELFDQRTVEHGVFISKLLSDGNFEFIGFHILDHLSGQIYFNAVLDPRDEK